MAGEFPEKKGGFVNEIKEYADIRLDEFKFKATRTLSTVLSRALSMFLVTGLLLILLGLLSVAMLQWLNGIFGAPVGTLIVSGVITILLIVIFVLRKVLFHGVFVNMLFGSAGIHNEEELERALADVEKRKARSEYKFDNRYRKVQSFLNPVSSISNIIGGKGFLGGLYLATTLVGKLFGKKKKK